VNGDFPDNSRMGKQDADFPLFHPQGKPPFANGMPVNPCLISEERPDFVGLSQPVADIGHRTDAFVNLRERGGRDSCSFLPRASGIRSGENDQEKTEPEGSDQNHHPPGRTAKTDGSHEISFRKKLPEYAGHLVEEVPEDFTSPGLQIKNKSGHGHSDRTSRHHLRFLFHLATGSPHRFQTRASGIPRDTPLL
jgi:hypothetical protein